MLEGWCRLVVGKGLRGATAEERGKDRGESQARKSETGEEGRKLIGLSSPEKHSAVLLLL